MGVEVPDGVVVRDPVTSYGTAAKQVAAEGLLVFASPP